MKIISIIAIAISFVIGVFAYLGSNNIIIAVIFVALYIAYYFLIARKKIAKYTIRVDQAHECYHFMNAFIITLSAKDSLDEAFQSGTRNAKASLQTQLDQMSEMNIDERLVYMRRYFDLSIYKIFIDLIHLYQDQGGNILVMSNNLVQESVRIEESLNSSVSISRRKLGEFISLWSLTFLVLLFIRFGLAEFYASMISSNAFIIILCAFFAVCLISIHFFLTYFSSLTLKKDNI